MRLGCVCAMFSLAAGLARADLNYAPSFEKAIERAKASKRQVLVVVVANVTDPRGRNPCQLLRQRTLGEATVRKLVAERFVPFLLDLDKVKAGREPMPEPLGPLFKPGAFIRLPMVLVYAPGAGGVGKLLGYLAPEDFARKLKAVPEKVASAVARKKEDVATAPDDQELGSAMEALEAALGGEPPSAADRRARAALQRGLTLEKEGRTAEAVALYRKIIEEFPTTPSAAEARKRLARLLAKPSRR